METARISVKKRLKYFLQEEKGENSNAIFWKESPIASYVLFIWRTKTLPLIFVLILLANTYKHVHRVRPYDLLVCEVHSKVTLRVGTAQYLRCACCNVLSLNRCWTITM